MQIPTIHSLPIEAISVIFSFLTEEEIENFNEITSCVNGRIYLDKLRTSTEYLQDQILKQACMESYSFLPKDRIELLYGLVLGWKERMKEYGAADKIAGKLISLRLLEFYPFFCKWAESKSINDFPMIFIGKVVSTNSPFWMVKKCVSKTEMTEALIFQLIELFIRNNPFYGVNLEAIVKLIRSYKYLYSDMSLPLSNFRFFENQITLFKLCEIPFHVNNIIDRIDTPLFVLIRKVCYVTAIKYLSDTSDKRVTRYMPTYTNYKISQEELDMLYASPKESVRLLGHIATENYDEIEKYFLDLEVANKKLLIYIYEYIPSEFLSKIFFSLSPDTQSKIIDNYPESFYAFSCNEILSLYDRVQNKV